MSIVETAKNVGLKLYTCVISRRGKAAKGTIEVQTFGVPIKPKKGTTTKKWKYDVDRHSVRDCLDALEQVAKLSPRQVKEAILRGADMLAKSTSLKALSAKSGITRMIIDLDLAMDLTAAENLASVWQQTQAFMKRSMMAVPTIEELAEQRAKYVAEQKEKGSWTSSPFTYDELIAQSEQEETATEESVSDDSDDESDDYDADLDSDE